MNRPSYAEGVGAGAGAGAGSAEEISTGLEKYLTEKGFTPERKIRYYSMSSHFVVYIQNKEYVVTSTGNYITKPTQGSLEEELYTTIQNYFRNKNTLP
jgi:hypothetical protein